MMMKSASMAVRLVSRGCRPAQADIDALDLAVGIDGRCGIFPAEAGGLDAAEGHARGRQVVGVDPAGAGLQSRDCAMGAGQIGGEDAGGEAELRSVGAGDHLVLVLEIEHRHDGAEDLLARDGHVVGHAGEDRRFHEEAVFESLNRRYAAADFQRRAFLFAGLDIAQHLVALGGGDQRPHLDGLVHRVADDDGACAFDKALDETVADRAVDEDAGAVGADLAGGVEIAEHGAADGVLDIGVLEDDQRRLAAKLHGDMTQAFGRARIDLAAGRHRACQRHLGDARIGGQRRADIAVALHDIEQAGGRTRIDKDLGELERRERRHLRRLEDHGIAAGQRRRAFQLAIWIG
jgi:hypothetical protein